MIRKSILLLFSLIILIVISGCGLLNRKSQTLDLLQNQVCAPPCWQGITPGTTTFDEAWIVAQSLDSADKGPNDQSPLSINRDMFSKFITISYKFAAVGFRPDSQGIIEEIGFTFGRHWDEPELQHLIEIYGKPISVDICHELLEIRRAVVWIRYPDVSFYFSEQLPAEGNLFTVHVRKDAGIDAIYYKSPDVEFPILDFSFPWSGYSDLTITPAEKNPLSTCP